MTQSPPPAVPHHPPRLAVILCAVLELEIEQLAAGKSHVVHIEKLPQGLHNEPDRLRVELQQAIDRCECRPDVQAIALGYGLCSRGTESVRTRRCLLVVPRAHDCITLLLGSRRRYADYVARHPGTYWYSPGWIKHHLPPGPQRYQQYYDQYLQRYGPDNADYLMQTEQAWFKQYNRAAYVDLGLGDTTADQHYTRQCADWLGWEYDRLTGDRRLLDDLLAGRWNQEDFLVLPPGRSFQLTGDDRIIAPTDPTCTDHDPPPSP